MAGMGEAPVRIAITIPTVSPYWCALSFSNAQVLEIAMLGAHRYGLPPTWSLQNQHEWPELFGGATLSFIVQMECTYFCELQLPT